MRKFTLFLMSLFLTVGAMAQTTQKVEVALTTTAGEPGYVSSPHDHAVINPDSPWDKGGVAALIDGKADTHFHTAWENVPAGPHYFQVDLGEGNTISDFSFNYTLRKDGGDDFPSQFTIKGSNNDGDYEKITVININNMPNSAAEAQGKSYSFDVTGVENEYRYLRFEVTKTKSYNGGGYRTYFHLAEFDLFKMVALPEYTVTYNYSYNDNVVKSVEHTVVEGSDYPAYDLNIYAVGYEGVPTGTVTKDETVTITVTVGDFPFEFYASVDAVKKANGWYNLVMHSNQNSGSIYRTYLGAGDDEKLAWGQYTSMTNADDDYYWAFVGDPISGFRVVNKSKSAEGKILSSNGEANPVLLLEEGLANGYNTTWAIAARNNNPGGDWVAEGDWFCLKYSDDWYMNANAGNGTVNFWNKDDNGSAILAVKPLEINAAAGVATYFSEAAISIPWTTGIEVYYASGINEAGYMGLEPITGIVAPNTGIVVRYGDVTGENVTFAPEIVSPGIATAPKDNLLKGTTKKTLITKYSDYAYYALALVDGEVGFYTANKDEDKFYNNAFKAYLEMPSQSQSNSLRFDFGTTAIEEVEVENVGAEVIYDLCGRRVNQITKAGVYIIGGRKVLVK